MRIQKDGRNVTEIEVEYLEVVELICAALQGRGLVDLEWMIGDVAIEGKHSTTSPNKFMPETFDTRSNIVINVTENTAIMCFQRGKNRNETFAKLLLYTKGRISGNYVLITSFYTCVQQICQSL